jgi:UDP-glucose 4-epimerase
MCVRSALVTGGTGFLGAALVRRLIARGDTVCLLTRPGRESDAKRVLSAAGPRADQALIRAAQGDATAALAGLRFSTVYHLAGGRVLGSFAEALSPNMTANVAPLTEILHRVTGMVGLDAFVFTSSGEVYGQQKVPFREEDEAEPRTAYGAAKRAAEVLGFAAFRSAGLPFIAARLGVLYGPGQAPPLFIPALVRAALRGESFAMSAGEQKRDFLFVEDAVDALLKLAEVPVIRGTAVNVSSGTSVTLREVAARILQMMGNPITLRLGALPYREGEAMEYELSGERMNRLAGWRACTSLDAGLERTIQGNRPVASHPVSA